VSAAFAITTPIYYVNGAPHIGHTYTTCVADTLARWRRLRGEEVYFQTGTDVHGDKAVEAALAAGEAPEAFTRRMSAEWRQTWDELGIAYDRFIQTTDADHVAGVKLILQRLWERGEITFREYEGLYCVGCERFLSDRDMQDGLCRDHERAPELRSESNYFFRMSRHFGWLARTLEEQPGLIRPARYKAEVLGMIRDDSGLSDLCISRPRQRLAWGIELPFDSNYVCYVWFDALLNYLVGCGFPEDSGWEARWRNTHHLIGKDILKPHGVFWPTMLHAAGLPLYRSLNVHGFWNMEDRKIGKSLGNMVDPRVMKQRYGFEPFRYFLLREMAYGQDGSFSDAALARRIDADLANNLGNLLSRTLDMLARYCGGRIPTPPGQDGASTEGEAERQLREATAETAAAVNRFVEEVTLHRALEAIFALLNQTNRTLEQCAPWKAAKEGRQKDVEEILRTCCNVLRAAGLLLAAFLPEAAAEILSRLGAASALKTARLPGDAAAWNALPPGTQTRKEPPVVARAPRP